MGKILVPQELQEQIINLYVKENKSRKEIRTTLNLSFGDSIIKRILIENNIKIRSSPEAEKGGRKKLQVDKDIQNQIIDLYVNKKYGLDKIVRVLQLPFGFDKVKNILIENGIHIRNINEAHEILKGSQGKRKYSINDDYNFESHNGAWILGFLAADGYLPNTRGARCRVTIEVAIKDKEILEKIKKELEYTGPLYEYDQILGNKVFKKASLTFTSKPIRQNIEKYGICNAKTFELKALPNLPEEYMFDFIRGFVDGDGSIYARTDSDIGMNLSVTCASHEFLLDMFNYLHKKLPLQYNGTIGKDHNNLSFRFGKTDSKIICSKLYDNDYLALSRKKEKFNSLR